MTEQIPSPSSTANLTTKVYKQTHVMTKNYSNFYTMNSFKKFFFGLTLLTVFQAFNILTANGQDSQQYDFSTIRINGLELDRYYTREQIINALGKPDEEDDVVYSYFVYNSTIVMAPASGDFSLSDARAAMKVTDEFGFGGIYGRDSVRFCVFTLNSDRFAVNDYIRVGDPVTKVYDMGGSVRDIKNTDGGGKLYWWASYVTDYIEDEDLMYNPAFWYDKNGIITKIELYYD